MRQTQSPLVAFLQRPFTSWLSTITYIGLCAVLLSIVTFLGKKYVNIVWRRAPPRTSLGSDQRRSLELLTSQHVYPRTPYPQSPLIQVTSASCDTSVSDNSRSPGKKEIKGRLQSKIARMPIVRNWVRVGSVEEGHIAKRRRLLSSKLE